MQGIIKRFDGARGFGFVACEAGDFFFHVTALLDEVATGDEVEFWLDDDPRQAGRLKAVDVRKVDILGAAKRAALSTR